MISERAAKVLIRLEQAAQLGGIPIVGPVKGQLLWELVQKRQPVFALEVGSAIGYSAILIAAALPPEGTLETIEKDPDRARQARDSLRQAGLDRKVTVLLGDARTVLPKVTETVDFLFLDGAKEEYLDYLAAVEGRLGPGAMVVADNAKVFADVLADYLDYVRHSGKYESALYDLGFDGLEVSRRR